MKLTIPAILVTALIAGSPTAFAQGMNYSGSSSNPATSVSKDDTTRAINKRSKGSHKQRHHAKAMSSKASTTGSGSNSPKPEKNDTTPKSRY